jgi:hypothetical protein
MEKSNEMDRALDLAEVLTSTNPGQEYIERARGELIKFTNPHAKYFLQTVLDLDEYKFKIAG